ncbi:uncharacterized protein LOC141901419 isoform X1 [Tubulanus polymorphus]|uniref:uncharacterized protein LOC141901419 isoform X1 n=1 Tax=Tubulanus polymorphus TaxID=672921 RepID=UPI003DA621A9
MLDMYEDQFEEFKARAKRGSVDSYLIGLQQRERAQQNVLKSKNISNLLNAQPQECSVSAPASRESTPPGSYVAPKMSTSPARSPGHTRSCSLRKKRNRPGELMLDFDPIRPRTSSMPTKNDFKKPDFLSPPSPTSYMKRSSEKDEDHCPLYRVRSFRTTSKGIVNRGDSFKSRSTNSVASTGSLGSTSRLSNSMDDCRAGGCSESVKSHGSTANSVASSTGSTAYRVIILGAGGVGKTAITKQFMTSEYMGAFDTTTGLLTPELTPETPVAVTSPGGTVRFRHDDDTEKSVSVLLDGEESTMYFVDTRSKEDFMNYDEADAYVVCYSITERSTFDSAVGILFSLRKHIAREVATILVGNKSDNVRSRQISADEGKETAVKYNCKFIETSAVLNHQIDDLLVGILKQIRLAPKREELKQKKRASRRSKRKENCVNKAARGFFDKLFRKDSVSKSCDNLLVL